jgi:iron(III) transport system ATP-binding protein
MLTVDTLVKTYKARKGADDVPAVNEVSLDIDRGKVLTLLGPSGCGKTTTLRSIAGLEDPDSGRIVVGDQVMFDSETGTNVAASKRGLGMVFQSYAIWPNMNVFGNVAFPLKIRPRRSKPSRNEIRERVERVLTTVRLDHLADRPATDLSGGQQQRLALARALVMEPPLLLLDEPLSNLDAKLREEMRFELKRLQRDLQITTVYVTHDQSEALAVSDRIAVMNQGVVEQTGKAREIYNKPATRFVAGFIGKSNFVDGSISGNRGDGLYEVTTPDGSLVVSSTLDLPNGHAVAVSIRPEHIELDEDLTASTGLGVWRGMVIGRAFLGDSVEHQLELGKTRLLVQCNATKSIAPGREVMIRFNPEACGLIPER